MSGRPEVSLVMPVWRPHERWFRAAVEGALGQVGCDLEVVVVDDGNPEPVTAQLADLDDPRLRVIRVGHGGVSAARNAGTAAAAGEHIRYVDADDGLPPEGTRRLLDHADGRAIVYGVTEVCDEDLEPMYRLQSDVRGDAKAACLLAGFDVRHVSMLIPADVARAAGPWDPTIAVCEDWDFVLRCVELAPVVPIPDVVTRYRRHPTSATRDRTGPALARHGQRRVIEKFAERHPQDGRPLVREAWARWYAQGARRALDERSPRAFLADAVALTRVAPARSAGVWADAGRRVARRLAARVPRPGVVAE